MADFFYFFFFRILDSRLDRPLGDEDLAAVAASCRSTSAASGVVAITEAAVNCRITLERHIRRIETGGFEVSDVDCVKAVAVSCSTGGGCHVR